MPEYRGKYGLEDAVLFTYKRGGYWAGRLIPQNPRGVFVLNEGEQLSLEATEQRVVSEATNRGFNVEDTWPPMHPSLGYYLGQALSWLSFRKWRG